MVAYQLLRLSAADIVGKYYEAQGGRPQPTEGSAKKTPRKSSKSAKDPQSDASQPPKKRQKRGAELEEDEIPRGGITESDIKAINTLHREENGTIKVHVDLTNGKGVSVNSDYAYKKFPQKMLKYYESKL